MTFTPTLLRFAIMLMLIPVLLPLTAPAQDNEDSREHKRYFNRTGVSMLTGAETTSPRLVMVNGYRFTSRFSAGLGAGFSFYNDPLSLIPLFLELKYTVGDGRLSPFLSLRGGYAFSTPTDGDTDTEVQDHHGGPMLNPAVGIETDTGYGVGLYLSAGYNVVRASYTVDIWDERRLRTDLTYQRLMIAAGIIF